MITLKKLTWGTAFRFGEDNCIQLDNATLTQILGDNGLGKSSIPLILEEVLFNKNSKPVKKASIPNRIYNQGYWINLTFQVDNDEYEINVTRKNSIKVKLFKNGADISSHTATGTYKTIQEIIGADFKTFSQLVYQNPKASLQFLTATDTNRKKFLIDLLHLEKYVTLFEIFKEAAKEVNIETAEFEAKVATIEKWLVNNKLTDTTILPMLNLDIDTDEDEKLARELTTEITNISQKNKKITKNRQYKKLLDAIDLNEINSSKVKQLESYDPLQKEMGALESKKSASVQLVDRLNRLEDVCHICEQNINPEFKANLISIETKKFAESKEQIKKLKRQINEIKKDNFEYTRINKLQKDWEDLYRSVDVSLPTILLDVDEFRTRLASVQDKLQKAKSQMADTARENQDRTKRNTRIQVIQEQTDEFIRELNTITNSLDKRRDLLSNLEMLKKAFSTNGLLAYKIENGVKDLEMLVNEYLSELADGRFTLEFVLSNDKLNVLITEDGDTVDITELSSGQLTRVNTATLLAIRKLMSSISKSRINVLFLDEVISVLDADGKEKLVEVLLQEKDLNTYVVSHGWEHPLLEKITVVDRNKISELE